MPHGVPGGRRWPDRRRTRHPAAREPGATRGRVRVRAGADGPRGRLACGGQRRGLCTHPRVDPNPDRRPAQTEPVLRALGGGDTVLGPLPPLPDPVPHATLAALVDEPQPTFLHLAEDAAHLLVHGDSGPRGGSSSPGRLDQSGTGPLARGQAAGRRRRSPTSSGRRCGDSWCGEAPIATGAGRSRGPGPPTAPGHRSQ